MSNPKPWQFQNSRSQTGQSAPITTSDLVVLDNHHCRRTYWFLSPGYQGPGSAGANPNGPYLCTSVRPDQIWLLRECQYWSRRSPYLARARPAIQTLERCKTTIDGFDIVIGRLNQTRPFPLALTLRVQRT